MGHKKKMKELQWGAVERRKETEAALRGSGGAGVGEKI